jgi:hypothetical protein
LQSRRRKPLYLSYYFTISHKSAITFLLLQL